VTGGTISRVGLLIAVAVLWGIPYVFIKVAVQAGLSPFVIVFFRAGIGTLVLLPFLARSVSLRRLIGRWRPLLAVAVCDVAVPFVLINIGEQSVSSALAGILVAATPLFVAILAIWVDRSERPDRGQSFGLLLGFGGVAVLLGGGPGGSGGSFQGAGLILLASFGYAVATLLVNQYLADLAPVAVTAAVLGLSTALLAVPAMLTWSPVWPRPTVLAALGCLGIACTGLAFLAYYALVATAGAARAAVSTYLAPGFSVLAGISLLGEEFTARSAAGLGLILLSSWLATRTRPARSPGHTPPSGEPC
jgi:drug/metabolite transporter (DMT)-like permease